MRDLDVNGCSPIGHQIDFDQGSGGVDVGHLRVEIIAAIPMMVDFQQMRTDKYERGFAIPRAFGR